VDPGNHAYVKTLYDAWIPEFGSRSGMDPDPVGFRVVGSGPDPDPAGTKMSRSGLDLKIVDPVHPYSIQLDHSTNKNQSYFEI